MNKRAIHLIIFVSMFCIALPVFASVTITPPISARDFPTLIGNIARVIGTIIGGLGTIMLMVAGIMFLFSAGNAERMGKAKAALTYAIIGIAIGLAANAIVNTILSML
jgi:Ca2+/Na+ antiporter